MVFVTRASICRWPSLQFLRWILNRITLSLNGKQKLPTISISVTFKSRHSSGFSCAFQTRKRFLEPRNVLGFSQIASLIKTNYRQIPNQPIPSRQVWSFRHICPLNIRKPRHVSTQDPRKLSSRQFRLCVGGAPRMLRSWKRAFRATRIPFSDSPDLGRPRCWGLARGIFRQLSSLDWRRGLVRRNRPVVAACWPIITQEASAGNCRRNSKVGLTRRSARDPPGAQGGKKALNH